MPSVQSAEVDRWIVRPRRHAGAGLRLYCIPFAGGGVTAYRGWAEGLPPWIDIGLIRLPGRESRLREAPFTSMGALVEALAAVLRPQMDTPFALFGHSLGALVAYELARLLQREHGMAPEQLFVSGRAAPSVQPPEPTVHTLPDGELIDILSRRYGGIPDAILQEPALLELYLPILRADFSVLESYVYTPGELLDCPVIALGGDTDPRVDRGQLVAWSELTRGEHALRMFPGGHFYFQDPGVRAAVLDEVAERLTLCQIPG